MIYLLRYETILAVIITLIGFSSSDADEDGYDMPRIFTEELIIPSVIPVPPKFRARMYQPWGEILPGGNMTYNDSTILPTKVTWPYEEGALYTLFMTGVADWKPASKRSPDYQQKVHGQEWHQWLISNIPGNNFSAGTEDVTHLLSGHPCIEGMSDLMLLLIYKQRGPIKVNVDIEPGWIEFQRNFRPYRFARRYRLGQPIAGTYHFIYYEGYGGEYDDYEIP